MIKRTCIQCGVEFETPQYEINRGRGKFCSRKCYHNSPKKRIKRICNYCKSEFEVIPSQVKYSRGKFCSAKCLTESLKRRIKRICKYCGMQFEVRPSRLKVGRGKFCSRECYGKWRSENITGEADPHWRGGKSFEPYCPKFNAKFKEYVRDKFGRVCFLCEKTEIENGRRLDVHHVNYDKDCGCGSDLTCQFVPLCVSCNSKVNFNREIWEAKIKCKMQNKLNGWYI